MTLMIENLLKDNSIDNENEKKMLTNIHKKVIHINFLIQSLLKLSKFDADTITFVDNEAFINSMLEEVKDNLKYDYENTIYNIEYSYHKVINNLEKENIILKKVINKFKDTVHKFISWICNKFDFSNEDTLIRDFEKENHCSLDTDKIIIDVTYKNRKNEHELGL